MFGLVGVAINSSEINLDTGSNIIKLTMSIDKAECMISVFASLWMVSQ